jgi:hypothetical protein
MARGQGWSWPAKSSNFVIQVQSALEENNRMSTTPIDEAKLKDVLKSAIVEILEERKDLVREVLEEAIEDIAFARAIEQGEQSKLVTRDEVFNALERNN